MQAYNALRGVAADVGRYVAVENQKANPLTIEQIRLQGTAIAVQPPYLLASNRVTVSVSEAPNQRVSRATELSFRISYVLPNVLRLTELPELTISYRQNLFVSAGTNA